VLPSPSPGQMLGLTVPDQPWIVDPGCGGGGLWLQNPGQFEWVDGVVLIFSVLFLTHSLC
jgi:hypothetical protein